MKYVKNILMIGLFAFYAWQQSIAQSSSFVTNTFTVGNSPSSVIATDINGDGKLDLVSANSSIPGTLTVLTNNGSGSFGFYATLPVGRSPQCVVAADINGDGKPDLISANLFDNSLTVLTNDGSGGFIFDATLPVGNNPECVVSADINGDNNVDLISASYYPNTLTVLTNNGSGSFGSNSTVTVGNIAQSGIQCVVAADINGDSNLDLITANYLAGTLAVLTNNGNGTFDPYATIAISGLPISVTVADVNDDGRLDLISATLGGFNNNSLTVFTNNNKGGFGLNATIPLPSGSNPYCVVAADINGDGKVDLISANQGNNTLTVFTNNGSGIFGLNATLIVGSGPQCIMSADLNGDGKPDLVSANGGSGSGNTLTVLLNEITFPQPVLNIKASDLNTLMVSWSSPLTGFALQTNSDLTTTNWGLPNYFIATNGLIKSVIFSPPPTGNLFFRLKN